MREATTGIPLPLEAVPEGSNRTRPQDGVPRLFVLGVTIAFVLLSSAPYALALLRAPARSHFTGVLFNHFDQNYYQAAQRSSARDLPQRNRFTSEPDAPGPVSPLYALAGRVEHFTGIPSAAAYHLPRVLATAVLPPLLTYLYSLCFPRRPRAVLWALLFALLAAGLITFFPLHPLAPRSGDGIPESNVLYSMTVFPHFAVSYVGITMAFTSLAMGLRGRRLRMIAAVAAAAGGLLAIGHPFLLLPFLVVVLGCIAWAGAKSLGWGGRIPVAPLMVAAIASLAPASALLYSLRQEQARLERLQGFDFPAAISDEWWTWVLGYGSVSLFVVPGAIHILRGRRRDPTTWLLLGWIAAQAAFMYLPYTVFQRRFSEGLILPLAAVAGLGIATIGGASRPARWLRVCTAVLLVTGGVVIVDRLGSSGQYLPDEVADLMASIRSNDIVMAGDALSSIVPAMSDGTAYAARPVETIHYKKKRHDVRQYAENPADDVSRQWLHREGITMLIVIDNDASFIPILDNPSTACLRTVFRRANLMAYRPDAQCLVSR